MVSARASGTEPCRGVAAGDHVLLDTKGGDIKAVDDILRGQNHLDVASDGHVQLVNFAMAFFVLKFPHPLFSHDVNFGGSARGSAFLEKDDRAPHEDHHENSEWYDRPGNFQYRGAFNLLGSVAGTTPIPGGKRKNHEKNGYAHERGQHDKENVEGVYIPCGRRGSCRPKWKIIKHNYVARAALE